MSDQDPRFYIKPEPKPLTILGAHYNSETCQIKFLGTYLRCKCINYFKMIILTMIIRIIICITLG